MITIEATDNRDATGTIHGTTITVEEALYLRKLFFDQEAVESGDTRGLHYRLWYLFYMLTADCD